MRHCLCNEPQLFQERMVQCDLCELWLHPRCVNLTDADCDRLGETPDVPWYCPRCAQSDLVCICRRPARQGEGFLTCGLCNDRFHPACVGLTEQLAETYNAERAPLFVCPPCAERDRLEKLDRSRQRRLEKMALNANEQQQRIQEEKPRRKRGLNDTTIVVHLKLQGVVFKESLVATPSTLPHVLSNEREPRQNEPRQQHQEPRQHRADVRSEPSQRHSPHQQSEPRHAPHLVASQHQLRLHLVAQQQDNYQHAPRAERRQHERPNGNVRPNGNFDSAVERRQPEPNGNVNSAVAPRAVERRQLERPNGNVPNGNVDSAVAASSLFTLKPKQGLLSVGLFRKPSEDRLRAADPRAADLRPRAAEEQVLFTQL